METLSARWSGASAGEQHEVTRACAAAPSQRSQSGGAQGTQQAASAAARPGASLSAGGATVLQPHHRQVQLRRLRQQLPRILIQCGRHHLGLRELLPHLRRSARRGARQGAGRLV